MKQKSIHERIVAILEREEAYKASFPPEISEDMRRRCLNARNKLAERFSDEQVWQFILDYENGTLKAPGLHFQDEIELLWQNHYHKPEPGKEKEHIEYIGGKYAADGFSRQQGRKRGGENSGDARKEAAKDMHDAIERRAREMLAAGSGPRELAGKLSPRFNLSSKQIRTILQQRGILPTKKGK